MLRCVAQHILEASSVVKENVVVSCYEWVSRVVISQAHVGIYLPHTKLYIYLYVYAYAPIYYKYICTRKHMKAYLGLCCITCKVSEHKTGVNVLENFLSVRLCNIQ